MTRCDFDGVFYRVFCVTLLAIAFTFTVILTNVFIDIDGLLSNNEKAKNDDPLPPQPETRNEDVSEARYAAYQNNKPVMAFQDNPEIKFQLNKPEIQFQEKRAERFYNNNYEDEADDAFRTKRSLDSEDFKFQIKNPKIKKILTNRLAMLLEELDAEETESARIGNLKAGRSKENIEKITERITNTKEAKYLKTRRYNSEQEDVTDDNNEDKILHLTMHNILLQGILGHMDLSEVYSKVRTLLRNLERERLFLNGRRQANEVKTKSSEASKDIFSKRNSKIEAKFFDEMVNCDELEKEKRDLRNLGDTRRSISEPKKEPNMLIKTVIDITSLNKNNKKENLSHSKENIKGIIKLIYNGKSIKFNRMEDEEVSKNIKPNEKVKDRTTEDPKVDARRQIEKAAADFSKSDLNSSNIPNEFLNKAISEYFNNHHSTGAVDLVRGKRSTVYNTKGQQSKRNIKIRGEQGNTIEQNKQSRIKKEKDDELYVEIETHFNNKGLNGHKKKKLIKDIVEKIRKAIQVDMEDTQFKSKYMHVKKRIQNPLDYMREGIPIDHVPNPVDKIELRESHPINKITLVDYSTPNLSDKTGENWKQTFVGPKFLSTSKSINSGEMGQLNLQYNKVIEANGIPQRFQQPLNPEGNNELETGRAYNDLGNLKFFIKEIDGSGFSIGFNQYVAEPPDPEAIKLFTGIQNLINSYHQKYDEPDPTTETDIMNKVSNTDNISEELNLKHKERYHELNKREINSKQNKIHKIFRRSTDDNRQDYHSNEYKIVFKNNYLPYDSYQEIYEDNNKKVSLSLQNNLEYNASHHSNNINSAIKGSASKIKQLPFVISENMFYKDLKPSEIFSIASFLDRKKRGVKLNKVVNINSKKTLSRYLNRKPKFDKKIYLKNKRNKRQIEKIRIIASDNLPNPPRHSEENIFVVSNEHLYADRAVVREVELPEVGDTDERPQEEHYDNSPPYVYETPQQPSYMSNIYSRFRHNPLMSKYPHIFMEEISRSKEDTENPKFYSQMIDNLHQELDEPENRRIGIALVTTERYLPSMVEIPSLDLQDIADTSRGNFKVTVKIQPKNSTSTIKEGIKEIHTSINKSITKDGLLYSSLVNLSEISKVENVSQPRNLVEPRRSNIGVTGIPLLNYIKEQQEKMKMLLKEHKMSVDEQLSNSKIQHVEPEDRKDRKSNELIDVIIPLNPPQILRLNKHEAGQLISSALMKLHSDSHINDATFFTTTSNSTTSQLTVQTTTTPPPTTKDPERAQIIKTIQHNENLTNMILKRINKNTDILLIFLSKLANRMEPVADSKKQEIQQSNTEENLFKTIAIDMPKQWQAQYISSSFYAQPISNFYYRNTSHLDIPFTFSYQHPVSVPNTNHMPVANVVYHGHIHANTANKKGNFKEGNEVTVKTPKVANNNETKFFIDELEAEYKEAPVRSARKPTPFSVTNNAKFNMTLV